MAWTGLTHVVLTHFHNDHVGDLPGLLIALKYGARPPRTAPLRVVGPVGLEALLTRMSDALGTRFLEPDFPLDLVEIQPGATVALGADTLHSYSTRHTDASLAYRVAGTWGSLAYTGDAAPDPELTRFMAGSTLVVSECTDAEPREGSLHQTPASVATAAIDIGPDLLVITHVYPPLSPEGAARQVGELWPGRVIAAHDGLRVVIDDGRCAVDRSRSPL